MDFKSINQVFENRLFRIPDYQRGYAWRSDADKEVVAFWNDLMNLPQGKSHFTGSLTLQLMSDTRQLGTDSWLIPEFTPWFVVDGQQRLTTIIILLQCIYEFLDRLPEDQFFLKQEIKAAKDNLRTKFICKVNQKDIITTYLFGYINNPVSENYLRRKVFQDQKVSISEQSYYTLNIQNAKDFFDKNIKLLFKESKNNLEVVEALYRKLTQQLKFQMIEVKPDDDFNIFVAFETINNRGRQLSNLEKLKNRLIYLTTLFDGNLTQTRNDINSAWAEIYRQLGRNYTHNKTGSGKVAVLDDDEFLKTHWILYYQYSRRTGSDYVNYLLGNKFTVQRVLKYLAQTESTQEIIEDEDDGYAVETDESEVAITKNDSSLTINEISDYVTDLQNTAEMWYYTWFPQDAVKELSEEEIRWMDRINRLGIAYFRPLITALFFERLVSGRIKENECIELLKAIERFIFIEFRLQTTRSNYGSSELNRAARELHKGSKTISDILKMIQDRIDHSFETDPTTGEKYFKALNMQVMVDKLFDQKDDERAGFYHWSAIHYFLYEYNASLAKYFHGNSVSWEDFKQSEKDKVSIEHIFPHKVTNEYWKKMFVDIPQEQWPVYQGSLGNLLLLSQSINAELQNDDFNTKKNGRISKDDKKRRNGYKNGSYFERKVSNKKKWTPAAIEDTGLEMLMFMEERWNFKFRSKKVKLSILLPTK